MAEEEGGGSPWETLWMLLGGIGILVVLWVAQGAKGADVRGIFLHPPPPVGTGGSYGPQIGTTTTIQQYNSQ